MKIRTQIFENLDYSVDVGSVIEISRDNVHHLKNVLRVRDDELIKVVINCREVAIAAVKVERKQLLAQVVSLEQVKNHESPVTTLCFAFCKSAQNEFICEKATELGVKNLIFWKSEHTGIKVKGTEEKLLRLNKIAKGAACQSKQDFLPRIEVKENLLEVVDVLKKEFSEKKNLFLYAALEGEVKFLHEIPEIKEKDSLMIHIFIGPEGGFSANEVRFMREFSVPISLGDSVLKAETAAVVAVAQVQALRMALRG